MKFQKKSTKWDTTIGILPKDKYDFILGHDLLKDLGLDIQCSASQYILNGIIIPSGHWTKNKISSVAKTWITNKSTQKKQSEANEDLNLAQILPTDYKPVDIAEVMNKQTCLTWKESENLLHALIDFQELFQMNNLFCIPTAYQKITTDEIAWQESTRLFTKVPLNGLHQLSSSLKRIKLCVSSPIFGESTSVWSATHIQCWKYNTYSEAWRNFDMQGNWFKHGLLFNALTRPSKETLCLKLTLGLLPIQHITSRNYTSHRHFQKRMGAFFLHASCHHLHGWYHCVRVCWLWNSPRMVASSRNQKLLMVSTICHLPGLSNYKGWHQTSAR